MEILVSLSALTPSQYRPYMKASRPDPKMVKLFEKLSKRKGRKAMRIYFDAQSDKIVRKVAPECPPEINAYLVDSGYLLQDYVSGTVIDKQGRTMRLGKVLKDPELKKKFDSDPERKALATISKGKKIVCLSIHPYDIAGMSTGRGWTSCMNLNDGSHKEYVVEDVRNHTMIAYLIDARDKDIKRPIARVLIKRFHARNSPSQFLYHVERVYPVPNPTFISTVQDFVNENINSELNPDMSLDGQFDLHEDLYSDTKRTMFPQLTMESTDREIVQNILWTQDLEDVPNYQWELLARRFKADLYSMVFTIPRQIDSSISGAVLNSVWDAVKKATTSEEFSRFAVSVADYAVRSKETLAVRILNMIFKHRESLAFKVMQTSSDFPYYMRSVAREYREPAKEMIARADFLLDQVRKGTLTKNVDSVLYQGLSKFLYEFSLADLVKFLNRNKDAVPDSLLEEYPDTFRFPAIQIKAAQKSKNPELVKAVTLSANIFATLIRTMSDAQERELAAATGTKDLYRAMTACLQDPLFFINLESQAKERGIVIDRDPDNLDSAVVYPVKDMNGMQMIQQLNTAYYAAVRKTAGIDSNT